MGTRDGCCDGSGVVVGKGVGAGDGFSEGFEVSVGTGVGSCDGLDGSGVGEEVGTLVISSP